MRREVTKMETLKTVLTVVQVLISVAMIVVIMMQSGKDAGLSGALSGNNETYMGKTGGSSKEKLLGNITKATAIVWVLMTLVICLL